MNNNKEAHLIQWDSNPQINNIIKKLISEWILPEHISYKNWEPYSNEIIDILKAELIKINPRKKIQLYVLINDFELLDDDRYFERIFEEDSISRIEEQNRSLFKEIYIKKVSIERNISKILDETLHFRRPLLSRWETIIVWIPNLNKIEQCLEWMRRNDIKKINIINWLDLNHLNSELDKVIKGFKKKKWINTEISLYLKDFLSSFISRIDIFKNIIWKDDLIKKFETRKKSKNKSSWWYFWVSIVLFLVIMSINIYNYFSVVKKEITIDEFIKHFLWQNIYLFFTEILLIILAFYFLSLFKTYRKVVELYDSHILLIESDFYYKNDEHFLWVDSSKLFDMRKENAQKIHLLPEKASEILNWKENITTEMPSWKILEGISNLINSLIEKLSSKK